MQMDRMNLMNNSKDVQRAIIDPPTCGQGVESAGEKGEKAKTIR